MKYKDVLHDPDPAFPKMAKLRAVGPDELLEGKHDSRKKELRLIFEISQNNDRLTLELKRMNPAYSAAYDASWILGESALEKRMKKLDFK